MKASLSFIIFTSTLRKLPMMLLKGYVRYKTITSENVSSEAQVLILWNTFVPFSRYSSFCIFNYPVIYQIFDGMVSIST